MKTLKSNTAGNISTALTQLGANSFRVSQSYLGSTSTQLGMSFFDNIDDATTNFNNLTK